jgi:hypothetical protein
MLRRVTPRSVAVFVALKNKSRVVLELYKRLSPGSYDTPLQSRGVETVALGANLHVCVVEWRDSTALASDQIYGYDLLITTNGVDRRLGDQIPNLLEPPYTLGYSERLPSFVLPPPRLNDLIVAHGSCRKPHGNPAPAGPDALAVLDAVIERTFTAPLERPHHLLLTGDQIYADDVSIALLATLSETGASLLGWADAEGFPAPDGRGGSIPPGHISVLPGPKRKQYIADQAGFSSEAADGHLMFLGEFCAMYLLAWSDELWPRASGGVDPQIRLPTAQELRPGIDPSLKVLGDRGAQDYMARIDAERTNVHTFAATLPRVRRALANVPTMTMFDDHEVTDDWYVHGQWADDVRSRASGRQIIRNALAAYAVFQDWGNHPENYATDKAGEQVLKALTYYDQSRLTPIQSQPAMLDRVLDIGQARTPLADRIRWDWHYAQADAEYQIVALDTRTFRSLSAGRDAPGLVASDSARTDEQLIADQMPMGFQLLVHKPADARVTMLLSPAPVIGHPIAELGQRVAVMSSANTAPSLRAELATAQQELDRLKAVTDPISAALLKSKIAKLSKRVAQLPAQIKAAQMAAAAAPAKYDNEAWSANRAAFEDLLRRLSGFGKVVILSGDVHYGYSSETAYFPSSPGALAARIVQFCSSALRNESGETHMLADMGYQALPEVLGWLGFDRDLSALSAALKGGLDARVLATKDTDPALAANAARLYFQFELNDRLKRPAVIPSAHYIDARVFAKVRDMARDPADDRDLTQWRYATAYLRDKRDAQSRAADWAALAAALSTDSRSAHKNRMFVGTDRAVVGQNNIAVVSFSAATAGGAVDQANHRLYWQRMVGESGQSQWFTLFTEHTARLSIPEDDERPEVEP